MVGNLLRRCVGFWLHDDHKRRTRTLLLCIQLCLEQGSEKRLTIRLLFALKNECQSLFNVTDDNVRFVSNRNSRAPRYNSVVSCWM
jgi:hypothetical protein